MNYKQISQETYRKFANKQGNDHIAGDYALEEILRIVGKFNIKNILEVGLGIGSISDAILNFSQQNSLDINYSGTEANEFCLEQLPLNVDRFNHIKLYAEISDIAGGNLFDFIVVDGSDALLFDVKKYCSKNAIIFIEGGRDSQVQILNRTFPDALFTRIMSIRKPPLYGPFQQRWSGGATIIAVNADRCQRRFIYEQKIRTFINRRLRRIFK